MYAKKGGAEFYIIEEFDNDLKCQCITSGGGDKKGEIIFILKAKIDRYYSTAPLPKFSLDKHQAEQAMQQGKKVHRENWAVDEFLEIKDGQMYDEKGSKMNITYLNTHYTGWGIKE